MAVRDTGINPKTPANCCGRWSADHTGQMAPEVFFTVCYNMSKPPPSLASEHAFHPAVLSGYSRRRVKLADYPGIIEQDGHTVRGTLATGLTQANLYRLDYFEGNEYERQTVKVKVDKAGVSNGDDDDGGGGGGVEAYVYVFKNPARLESREWDYDEFRREKLRHWSRADLVFDGRSGPHPHIGFSTAQHLTPNRL